MSEQQTNEEKLHEAFKEIDELLFKLKIAYSIIAILAISLFIIFEIFK